MVGRHHQPDEPEFEQALGVADGQRSLVCCSPWGCKESDTTEWLNCTELIYYIIPYHIIPYHITSCIHIFFDVNHFLSLYWIFYNIPSVLCLLFWPWGMWDLGSLIRDRTYNPCIGRWSLNHWTTKKVPPKVLSSKSVNLLCMRPRWKFLIPNVRGLHCTLMGK